ncbi:tetratricopeptide repeat protein [Methyloligella sp. GL2]|uniref:tetratricopeptide repeat protein n=2 Tax=unclassified Methyloligella TaxID=2625955 RepID=UPI001ABB1B56|nr:tetratricopeptide repeat protein [Methyloligella sp. GL2]
MTFCGTPALAQVDAAGEAATQTGVFSSATAAYRQGISSFRSGAIKAGLPALRFAADRGVLGAQLRLAELYAAGDSVPKDDGKAYYYYRQIADTYAEITPRNPVSKYVAQSFVALGRYQLEGIPEIELAPNPRHAAGLFQHAATYFGDADAQYELAKLYLSGTGVERNFRLGANWLATAARKQHAASQATLGEMIWRGEKLQSRQVRGLALIALAHHNASEHGQAEPAWIKQLYDEAFEDADPRVLKATEAAIPRWGGPQIALLPTEVETPVVSVETPAAASLGGFLLGNAEPASAASNAVRDAANSAVDHVPVAAGTATALEGTPAEVFAEDFRPAGQSETILGFGTDAPPAPVPSSSSAAAASAERASGGFSFPGTGAGMGGMSMGFSGSPAP